MTTHTDELNRAFHEQSLDNLQRLSNWFDAFVVNPDDPATGVTPRDVIWKRGKIQLFHYRPQSEAVSAVPHFIVPWLGITRPDVLDLIPGQSMIEFLLQQGHDIYMLDWGVITEDDYHLGFEALVCNVMPRAVSRVLENSGASTLTLNGICLGGLISLCYLALNPNAPVKNFVSIVTPVDFDQGGLFKTWIGNDDFPGELIVELYRGIPPGLMDLGFKMLRPTNDAATLAGLYFNLHKKSYIPSYKAMDRWANHFVGLPGRFFSQLRKELYLRNQLLQGDFRIKGRRVAPGNIHQPLLAVAASHDNIVPPWRPRVW